MPVLPMELTFSQTTQILERTPSVLNTLLRDLDGSWITGTEGPGTWSPCEVVGHLIHGEQTDWMARVRIILDHGEQRPFEPFDRFAFARRTEYEPLTDLLDQFQDLRDENLRALRALELTEQQLERTGTHPEFGRVTMAQLLATWAVHDLSHIAQIARVMAKQYRAAVGPWSAYLPILTR
jgi:DinB superfamily